MAESSGDKVENGMEVDDNLPNRVAVVPDEGALGDDERTETERSPKDKKLEPGATSPRESGDPSPGDVNGRRKKHRRGKNKGGKNHNHRKWKPYNKLTWDEKKELEERETARANRKREERFASGQPMAPYNTTQFLMEQHEPSDPEYRKDPVDGAGGDEHHRTTSKGDGSGSVESSDDYNYDSPENEEAFLEKDFAEAYENEHAERLQLMTKDELVREYLELESKVERLEKQVKGDSPKRGMSVNGLHVQKASVISMDEGSQDIKLQDKLNLEEEIRRLKSENSNLKTENERLTKPKT